MGCCCQSTQSKSKGDAKIQGQQQQVLVLYSAPAPVSNNETSQLPQNVQDPRDAELDPKEQVVDGQSVNQVSEDTKHDPTTDIQLDQIQIQENTDHQPLESQNAKSSDPNHILHHYLEQVFKCHPNQIEVQSYKFEKYPLIAEAQQLTLKDLLANEFFERSESGSKIDVKSAQQEVIKKMSKVNGLNWQVFIVQPDGTEIPINDFEGMKISHVLSSIDQAKVDERQSIPKFLVLPSSGLVLNLYSLVALTKDGKTKLIRKASTNNKKDRVRPPGCVKSFDQGMALVSQTSLQNRVFAEDYGEFGNEYVDKINGGEIPTVNQMIEGLFVWYEAQIIVRFVGKSAAQQKMIIGSYKKTFNEMTAMIDFKDTNKPFTYDSYDDDLGLWNPYSRITCFVLYLYSMEFGNPPLYAELNRVCRQMDRTQLHTLGPFAYALYQITSYAEHNRKSGDRRERGREIYEQGKGVEHNFGGSFIVFKGVQMKQEWYAPWLERLNNMVLLPSNSSFSHDLKTGLKFAIKDKKPDFDAVLFVLTCQNYHGVRGINLNNEAYSAYPEEGEYFFLEGAPVFVIGVEKEVEIKNERTSFAYYNGQKMTVIHIFQNF